MHLLPPPCRRHLGCRQRLHDNRGLWQEGRPLRGNLEAVLQLALPQRQGEDAEEASADCAICYAYRLLPAEGGAAEDGACVSCRQLTAVGSCCNSR